MECKANAKGRLILSDVLNVDTTTCRCLNKYCEKVMPYSGQALRLVLFFSFFLVRLTHNPQSLTMANKSKKRSSTMSENKDQNKPELSPSSNKKREKDVKRNVPLEEDLSDEEDGDVDEEGMAKLLNALGEDGLDDIGKMQLEILEQDAGSSSGDEDGSEEGIEEAEESDANGSSEGEEEEGEGAEDDAESGNEVEEAEEGIDNEEVVALEDAESVDEDAVPRQKIVTDNKVQFILHPLYYQLTLL